MLTELFHVCAHEHLAKLHKVAVILVVNLDHTPRIRSAAHAPPVGGVYFLVRPNYGERNLGLCNVIIVSRIDMNSKQAATYSNLFILGDCLFVLIIIDRCLEDLDVVVSDVVEHL